LNLQVELEIVEALKRFHRIHSGETALVIGNGPSLNNTPLKELSERYVSMGSNKIYRLPFTPKYYCIIDEEMAATCIPLPADFKPEEMFIRAEYGIGNPIYPIVASGFGLDISNFVVMGGSVTFALLQLAFYMDFSTVVLVGIDHNYPKASQYERCRFTAKGNDPDHFRCPDGRPYFEEGKVFNPPELDGLTQAYKIADEVYSKTNKSIINLTPDTHLDVFKKDNWNNWLR